MAQKYEVYLLSPGNEKQFLGEMPMSSVTFNRYNEGLLVAAGKISKTNIKDSAFLKFSALFRDKAFLEFRTDDIAYSGSFCFINFDAETSIVVFGSLGAVTQLPLKSTVETTRVPVQQPAAPEIQASL